MGAVVAIAVSRPPTTGKQWDIGTKTGEPSIGAV